MDQPPDACIKSCKVWIQFATKGARMEVDMQSATIMLFLGLMVGTLTVQAALPAWARQTVDYSDYGELLKKHVKHGMVDYRGFKQDEPRLDRYLSRLEEVDPLKLGRNEQMAFFINAYNAWTIKLILNHYPGVHSIKDLGTLFQSPWKKKFVRIHGQTVTLDHIEHDILRPLFKDPRIHFAVNCASKSCPPLLDEPYKGMTLDSQLNRMTINFINDPQRNFIKDGILYVSRIFKWFGEDFNHDILGYVRSYARGNLARQMDGASKTLKIKYLDYDWSLNGI